MEMVLAICAECTSTHIAHHRSLHTECYSEANTGRTKAVSGVQWWCFISLIWSRDQTTSLILSVYQNWYCGDCFWSLHFMNRLYKQWWWCTILCTLFWPCFPVWAKRCLTQILCSFNLFLQHFHAKLCFFFHHFLVNLHILMLSIIHVNLYNFLYVSILYTADTSKKKCDILKKSVAELPSQLCIYPCFIFPNGCVMPKY